MEGVRLDQFPESLGRFLIPPTCSGCAPGGTEFLGVWMEGRGRLPDIPFLYPSSNRPTQCFKVRRGLIPDAPFALQCTQT